MSSAELRDCANLVMNLRGSAHPTATTLSGANLTDFGQSSTAHIWVCGCRLQCRAHVLLAYGYSLSCNPLLDTAWIARSAARACVNLAEGGCVVARDRQIAPVPPVPVKVVDTTGAGDTFAGAPAVALLEKTPHAGGPARASLRLTTGNGARARFFKGRVRGGATIASIMTAYGFTLFDTAIGRCAIAWGARGVVGVQLPEARELETRARLLRRHPDAREGASPPDVQRALDGIAALLRGKASDLAAVPLDMDHVPPFDRRVYEVVRSIPPGATLSYGDIAARLGAAPGASRAVGQALGRNPFAIIVPCHRVLAASGKVGGFSANGGVTTKLRLLSIEGALANRAPTLFDGERISGRAAPPPAPARARAR